jgi:hypothetical protein
MLGCPGGLAEEILRHVGFVSYKSVPAREVMRLVAPDILVTLIAALCLIAAKRLNETAALTAQNSSTPLLELVDSSTGTSVFDSNSFFDAAFRRNPFALEIFTQLGCVFVLGTLLFAGAIRPSVTSAVYYVAFLGLGTAWACHKAISRPVLGCLCKVLAVYSGVHVVALFLYQTQIFQEMLPPAELMARYWTGFFTP